MEYCQDRAGLACSSNICYNATYSCFVPMTTPSTTVNTIINNQTVECGSAITICLSFLVCLLIAAVIYLCLKVKLMTDESVMLGRRVGLDHNQIFALSRARRYKRSAWDTDMESIY